MADFTIGVVVHPRRPTGPSLEILQTWATGHDVRVLGRDSDAERLRHGTRQPIETVAEADFIQQVNGLVSLGGDGTMLGAMRLVAERPDPVPVIGVNYGNLAFLIELSPADLPMALDRLLSGDFVLEDRHALRISVDGAETPRRSLAFNDIVLGHPTGGTLLAELQVNDARYGHYRCDALVVSTPMGSTAYNYAAGGPIVSPAAPVSVLTPVAPMSGINRPLVMSADELVRLDLTATDAPLLVSVDGRPAMTATSDVTFRLRLLLGAGHIVRFDPEAHSHRSRIKLSLLDLPVRTDQLLELIPPELRERPAPA